MPLYEFKVTIEIEGPVLTHSSVPGKWGINAPFNRDVDGCRALPWTLVKGRLLESWTALRALGGEAFSPDIRKLLGVATGSETEIQVGAPPRRGTLRGSDFVMVADGSHKDRVLYRIQIDDERGGAQTGMYQVVESPLAPGERGMFGGVLTIHASGKEDARKVAVWLDKGLRWIPSIGAFRSIGFGTVRSVTVEGPAEVAGARPAAAAFPTDGRVSLAIQLDRPFEVSRAQPNSNLFESEVVLPGGVLKGALAATWAESLGKNPWDAVGAGFDARRPELCASFHLIRFSHAAPEENGKRPVQIPLSAVIVGGDELLDVALAEGPGLLDKRAPAFQPDWKDSQIGRARKAFGWPDLRTELRVRTAIEKGIAAGGKLFAYESVIPGDRRWLFHIDLSAIENAETRSHAGRQLLDLLARGIRGVGKTKANTKQLDILGQPAPPAAPEKSRNDDFVVLTLQADALLFDAQALAEPSGEADLRALYADYFRRASEGSMVLVRYFARQRLAGGWYLHARFQTGKPYQPMALTEAGSVFVLKTENDKKAREVLYRWRARGLGIPDSVAKRLTRTIDGTPVSGADWRNCPFVPANGWGEVAIDLAFHGDRRIDTNPLFEAEPRSATEVAR
jgi:hypothetical protein